MREQYMQYRSGRAGEVYDICAHLALSCSLLRSKSANFPVTIFSSFCVSASCSHAAQDTGGIRERRNEGHASMGTVAVPLEKRRQARALR